MKPASINEIKKELTNRSAAEIFDYCLRLAKFKKENKELLSFILFEEDNLAGFISSVKKETN